MKFNRKYLAFLSLFCISSLAVAYVAQPETNRLAVSSKSTQALVPLRTAHASVPQTLEMVACIKTNPLANTLNTYLSLLETVAPQQASIISLLSLGGLGGVKCPGISTSDPCFMFLFRDNKEQFFPCFLFNAQKNAYLLTVLDTNDKDKDASSNVVYEIPSPTKIAGHWYLVAPQSIIESIKPQVDDLFQFLTPPTGDIEFQIFSNFWKNNTIFNTCLANFPEVNVLVNKMLDNIQYLSFSCAKVNSSTNDCIKWTSKIFYKEPSSFWEQKNNFTISVPNLFIQNPIRVVSYCPFSKFKAFLENIANDCLKIFPAPAISKDPNQPAQKPSNGHKIALGLQDLVQKIKPLLDFCQKYLTGYNCSFSQLEYDTKTQHVNNCGAGIYFHSQLPNALLVEHMKRFFNDLQQWVQNLPNYLPDNYATLLKDANKYLVCRFDENIFNHKNYPIHGFTIQALLPWGSVQHQIFLTICKDNLLYADNKDFIEKLIDDCEQQAKWSQVALDANTYEYIQIDTQQLLYFLNPEKLLKVAPKSPVNKLINYYIQYYPSHFVLNMEASIGSIKQLLDGFSSLDKKSDAKVSDKLPVVEASKSISK